MVDATFFEDGAQRRDFVHVRDVARANLLALDDPRPGAFNVASGTPRGVGEMAAALARATDGPAPEIVQPSAPLAIAPSRTASKPGISCERCFSMTTSSNEARIMSRSFV